MELEHLEITLREIAHLVSLVIETCAVLFIAIGAIAALLKIVRVGMGKRTDDADYQRRAVWLSFARWLVAGLTFQLAADIVNTSFSPTWEELGHLAAIAVIRTFLNFFLEREVEEKIEMQEGFEKRSA
ncbi:DUF1622 domain-containing protein [Variovorax rhizosphaerae]|uniref:DUF1622 domain-containing protein n=1 Tax=Variovorax rhizosphaerae TaxID=1836200 RepID=A0ABU8WIF9_9BURK